MSLMFTHHDNRTNVCDHDGTLGRAGADGGRSCIRCGATVHPKPEAQSFTKPARRELDRRTTPAPR